ncbi:MAG TPA: hypothetical protein VKB96_05360 [Gammaproteobacteria bacterium]|nr:hypothetical protein [Gammaproteobacteria bacterium]
MTSLNRGGAAHCTWEDGACSYFADARNNQFIQRSLGHHCVRRLPTAEQSYHFQLNDSPRSLLNVFVHPLPITEITEVFSGGFYSSRDGTRLENEPARRSFCELNCEIAPSSMPSRRAKSFEAEVYSCCATSGMFRGGFIAETTNQFQG